MRRAARGSRGGRSKPCSTVVHSLGAALDHDDPTVAKLAHVPIAIRARPQGPPPTISTINHHICLWADTRARTLEPSFIFVHLCGQLRQLHSCPYFRAQHSYSTGRMHGQSSQRWKQSRDRESALRRRMTVAPQRGRAACGAAYLRRHGCRWGRS